jgi:hypothetical protein
MEEILNFEINPRTFKKFLNVIDTIFDECVFKFNAEGLQCATVDRSNVMMLDISMPKDTFSKYELKKDIEIGFNIKEFLEFLKGAKKHYTLSFKIIDNELISDPKCYQLMANTQWSYSPDKIDIFKTLSVSTIDITSLRKTPNFNYIKSRFNVSFDVKRDHFNNIIEFAKSKGIESLLIEAEKPTKDQIYFSADIKEVTPDNRISYTAQLLYNADMLDLKKEFADLPVKGHYSVNYMSDINKGLECLNWLHFDMCNKPEVCYGKTFVLRISGEFEGIKAFYYLAPRIEND